MIRIVPLRKAALAGVAGAAAWEIALRTLALAGLPSFDIVRQLGTLAFSESRPLAWWTAGMTAHATVGALWAIFYAYFFWSRLDRSPTVQGLVFSLLPAALALLIAYPQLVLMHQNQGAAMLDPVGILRAMGWPQAAGLVAGHLIFGATMGTLYTKPVGYAAGRPRALPVRRRRPAKSRGKKARRPQADNSFIFATGIECSYPTIDQGRWRFDEMDATGHYRDWPRDLERATEIGVTHLRWGPPLHLVCTGPDRIDWSFSDEVMAGLKAADLEPIVDLCHFGLPAWLGDFQNPEVPAALANYAAAFARRYPWARFYTPVNEMYVCAKFSALDGIWNEQRRDERSFTTAVRHLAKASALIMDGVRAERRDAVFMNSESSEFYQACCPEPAIVRAEEFENERRFLPLDLLYARPVSGQMKSYLLENGMSEEDYAWFMARPSPRRAILGVDYYEWNEKLIDSEGRPQSLGELFGWYVIASQYWERYRRPMMHAETNRLDARDAPRWLWRQWHNVQLLRKSGVPLVGFTWYSLADQVDWRVALSAALGGVDPVGLVDLNRDLRPVGLAYKYLIETYRDQPDLAHCAALDALLAETVRP